MSETTYTSRPVTDWNARTFTLIAEGSHDENLAGTPRIQMVGHDTVDCPKASTTGHVAHETSLDDYLRQNEFFDGEVAFDQVWPCGTCVTVANTSERPLSFIAEDHGETEHLGPVANAEPKAPYERPEIEGEDEAIAFAKTYAGDFEFMVSMREKCSRPVVRLSPKMVAAILRCKARAETPAAAAAPVRKNSYAGPCGNCRNEVAAEAGRIEKVDGRWVAFHLDGSCPSEAPQSAQEARPAAPAPSATPDVPAGRYAVENEEGSLAFYKVDRPEEGRWAGYTFVKVQASDDYFPVRGAAAKTVLAKIAVDPQGAMLRYGRELGHCGHCGRTLTDEDSRARGIGPVCLEKVGF